MSVGEAMAVRAVAPSPLRRTRRTGSTLGIVVILILLLAPVALFPFGIRMLVVDGGSMAPTYAVGDVLFVGAPTGDDLVAGEPVVVGDGASRYVHRVLEVDGDRARLQGDANAVHDLGWVTQADVSGVVLAHVASPVAGVLVLFTSVPGRIALALALMSLLLWSLVPPRAGPRATRSTYRTPEGEPGGSAR